MVLREYMEKPAKDLIKYVDDNISGNPNITTLGSAMLNYKGAELNSQSTKKLTFATWILALFALGQLITLIVNVFIIPNYQ